MTKAISPSTHGCKHCAERQLFAVGNGHGVEEDAEVGPVDAELLLDRLRGEADLATREPRAALHP
jgi:hypothetical protein